MPLTLAHKTAAFRMLLAAWCADNEGISLAERDWLLRHLVDPGWCPGPMLRPHIAPRFLAWAEYRGIREIALKALGEEAVPSRDELEAVPF